MAESTRLLPALGLMVFVTLSESLSRSGPRRTPLTFQGSELELQTLNHLRTRGGWP